MQNKIISKAPGRVCLFGDHQDYLGLPIIATNAGDASVILKNYPNSKIANTEKDFSELLNNLDMHNFAERNKTAKDFRKRFSFDKTVSNYINFFETL